MGEGGGCLEPLVVSIVPDFCEGNPGNEGREKTGREKHVVEASEVTLFLFNAGRDRGRERDLNLRIDGAVGEGCLTPLMVLLSWGGGGG